MEGNLNKTFNNVKETTNNYLKLFNLPILKEINFLKQSFALILRYLKWAMLLLALLLLMPYNTPETNINTTKIIYPSVEIALLSTVLLIMTFIAMYGWEKVLYQMTYKDVIRVIERAEANRLFSSEIAEVLIALVWKAKEYRDEEKNKKKTRTLAHYQAILKQRGIDYNLENLIEENMSLHNELEQYKEIQEIVDNNQEGSVDG